jgi:hypothetical protein
MLNNVLCSNEIRQQQVPRFSLALACRRRTISYAAADILLSAVVLDYAVLYMSRLP